MAHLRGPSLVGASALVSDQKDARRSHMAETASLQFVAIFRMQGGSAFLDGVPVNENPWLIGTEEHRAWCDGWIDESEHVNG